MRILELPVNKFFFNEAKKHDLVEDYRAIKPYWIKRLLKKEFQSLEPIDVVKRFFAGDTDLFQSYDKVVFKNGYADNSPTYEATFEGMRFTQSHEMTCMGRGIAFAIKIGYSK